jgi:Tfp pilus assembly protein PilO
MKKKFTWKHGVALSLVVLMGVYFSFFYFLYVPKKNEYANLKSQLEQMKQSNQKLLATPLPKEISQAEKESLAVLIPTSFEEPRFINNLHEIGKKSGVLIRELNFEDKKEQEGQAGQQSLLPMSVNEQKKGSTSASTGQLVNPEATKSKDQAKDTTKEKQTALTEKVGKIKIEGTYTQVRSFFAQFAQITRLVMLQNWTMRVNEDSLRTETLTPKSTLGPAQNPTSNKIGTPSLPDTGATKVDKVPDWVKNNPYLSDRTPIRSQQDYLRVLVLLESKYKQNPNPTQKDKDLLNLEIQQTVNRYIAGLTQQEEADSILDMDYAGNYVKDANTDIRKVLGMPPRTADPKGAPTSLLVSSPGTSDQPNTGQHQAAQTNFSSTVRVNPNALLEVEFHFAVYFAPQAKELLPAPTPMDTYLPSQRINPVDE